MKNIVLSSFSILFPFLLFAQEPGVSEVHYDFPSALMHDTLIIPAYETFSTKGLTGKDLQKTKRINALSKEHNETQRKLLVKYYPFPWKMVPLALVEAHKNRGHYYYLDYVPMPRHWRVPNPEAMVAMFLRYDRTLQIYRISNFQFWYYFYIRDLSTDQAYMSNPPHGHADVYTGMKWLWKHVAKVVK
ncbi:MAG: hypothetical protein AB8F95_12650 [Bacteroidia bacterium]